MTVHEACWEKVPTLPLDPSQIGDALTDDQLKKLAVSFVILANYVSEQEARCGDKTTEADVE